MPTPSSSAPPRVDVAVVGAGFGGLGAALHLAEANASVALFEGLRYPGGCASTFTRGGARHEAGATLFCGLGPEQPFGRWRARHGMDVEFQLLDVPVELRAPGLNLPVFADKARFIDQLCSLPDAPVDGIRRFFATQQKIADALWPVLDDAGRLPPFTLPGLGFHARRAHRYLPLASWLGRPAIALARECGVADFGPLRLWMDAISQITVQADMASAEAPFALSTLDYCFRGAGHVHGGIGELANAMVHAVRQLGGAVHMPSRVHRLERTDGGWRVHHRGGTTEARTVVANLIPTALAKLLAPEERPLRLEAAAREEAGSWGAVMLYLQLHPEAPIPEGPHHIELVADPDAPLVAGNHVFCSISGAAEERAPEGRRVATVSTHLDLATLRGHPSEAQAQRVHAVQKRMRETLASLAPAVDEAIVHADPGSPRTFARFIRRTEGRVGGTPRAVGLHHYATILPRPVSKGLWRVGDAAFPGQSTLATALGGQRTARAILRGAA
ncbi:MAG: FAD-dependent oxidoreductase [Myxococcota bacterium]|nr:FAD-dependent oxidoreductase [Myxococcota bacterium]